MLKKVKEEERLREEAGYYDEDLDSDDEDTRKWLADADIIEEREKLRRIEHTLNKSDKPQIPRRIIKKRERTMDKFEGEMESLRVDMKKRKMTNMVDESMKQQRGKSVKRVGRSLSLQPKVAIPKDQWLPDLEVWYIFMYERIQSFNFSCVKRHRRFVARHKSHGRKNRARAKLTAESSTTVQSIYSVESAELERRSDVNSLLSSVVFVVILSTK